MEVGSRKTIRARIRSKLRELCANCKGFGSRTRPMAMFLGAGLAFGVATPPPGLVAILVLTIAKLPNTLPLVVFEVLKVLAGQFWAAIIF